MNNEYRMLILDDNEVCILLDALTITLDMERDEDQRKVMNQLFERVLAILPVEEDEE